jgi:NTP pyrophosphatase (non-canonical NTP hydrolase)
VKTIKKIGPAVPDKLNIKKGAVQKKAPVEFSDSKTTIAELKKVMKNFVNEREWDKYHDPKNLSMSIAIEAAELMELFQWIKNEEAMAVTKDSPLYTEACDEISDIMLYCLSLANVLKIDLASAITNKVVKNVKKYPKDICRGDYKKPHKTAACAG